jgi:hypothetical protein
MHGTINVKLLLILWTEYIFNDLTIWLINWLGRYARVIDHLAVENVAQVAPLGGGSILHPILEGQGKYDGKLTLFLL